MNLNPAEMRRLEEDAKRFASEGHRHYLAEALQCTTATNNPLEALELLAAMFGSGYAGRNEQKEALNAVGIWLEERLHREPKVAAARIALEIGWLRRIACYHDAPGQPGETARRGQSRDRRPYRQAMPELRFGKRERIESIRSGRETAPVAQATAPSPADKPAPPPAPSRLPDVFEAELVDFRQARDARRTAQKRQRDKKPPKERLLEIRPVDPQLQRIAPRLVCSILEMGNNGLEALFEAVEAQAGTPRPFYVALTDLEPRDGQTIVRRIRLSAPEEPGRG